MKNIKSNIKNAGNTGNSDLVLIPMIVDRESYKENGPIAGVEMSEIRKWKIGNRILDVILVPGTREEYKEYLRTFYAEIKAEDRDKRCRISNSDGKEIRCPETNKCSQCDYNYSLDKQASSTIPFSTLMYINEDNEENSFEAESPEDYFEADRYLKIVADLIEEVNKRNPEYGEILGMLCLEYTQKEIAKATGIKKSTLSDKIRKKIRPLVKDLLEEII